MKLKKISNANRHPKSSLNIEVAHVAVDETQYISKLQTAFESSFHVEKSLELSRYGFRAVRSLLVDDKRRSDLDRNQWFDEVTSALPEQFQSLDYITFESDLKNLLNTFYSRLRPDKQNTVKNDIERYLAKRKRTACSHDISLWHSMRLGALGGKGLPIFEIVTPDGIESKLRSSFVASNVCSILPTTDRNFEEDAETDILRHLDYRYADWRKVKRYFYET